MSCRDWKNLTVDTGILEGRTSIIMYLSSCPVSLSSAGSISGMEVMISTDEGRVAEVDAIAEHGSADDGDGVVFTIFLNGAILGNLKRYI